MKVPIALLVLVLAGCCTTANGFLGFIKKTVSDVKDKISDVPKVVNKIPDVVQKIPDVTDIKDKVTKHLPPIPGFGDQKACSKDLSIVAYMNCCGPQLSCDLSKVSNGLRPESLKSMSCQALKNGISTSGQLNSVMPGVDPKSSNCLSSTMGDKFLSFNGPISKWNQATFKSLPSSLLSGFNISSLKHVSPSVFNTVDGLVKVGTSMKTMTPGQISSMLPALKTSMGTIDRWDSATLKNVLNNAPRSLCGFSISEISQIKSATVTDAITEVSDAVHGCTGLTQTRGLARSFLKKYQEAKGPTSSWSATTLNILNNELKGELGTVDLLSLSKDALADPRTLAKSDALFNAEQKQILAAALLVTEPDVLKAMPTALTSMRDSDIDKVDCATVGQFFLQSSNYKVSRQGVLRVVERVRKCGFTAVKSTAFSGAGQVEHFTPTDVNSLSPYLAGFSTDDITKMNMGTNFASTVNNHISDSLTDAQGRAVFTKVKEGVSRPDLADMASMGRFMTAEDIVTLDKATTLQEIKTATTKGLRVDTDVASQFADVALKELRTDFSDVTKFPSNSIFNELGENIVKGFNRTTFRNLPVTGFDGFASSASNFDLSAGQFHEMGKRFSEDLVTAFSEQDVRGFGRLVAHWNSSVLDKLAAGAKAQVARNLGQAKRLLGIAGDKARIMELVGKATSWLNASTGNLDYNQVLSLGSLVHFIPISRIQTLSADDLKSAVGKLSEIPIGETIEDTKARLQNVANTVFNKLKAAESYLDPEIVKNLGPAVCHLPDAYFNAIKSKVGFDQILDTVGDAACDATSKASRTVLSKAKEYYTKGTGKAGDVTHSVLKAMNKTLPAMSTDDLLSLSKDTIKDSLETLGQAGFSLGQAKTLVNKLVPGASGRRRRRRRRSISSELSASQVKVLGSLACALHPTQLAGHLHDSDIVCSLSKETCYTSSQKASYIAQLKKIRSLAAHSKETLSCLGEWATSLDAADVDHFTTHFKYAASSLGKRDYGTTALRAAFGSLAVKVYGANVASWKAGVIRTLGNITGYIGMDSSSNGCNSATVQTITTDQIGIIHPSVVPFMQNLRCMTDDQLSSFDGEQVRAFTPGQVQSLSAAQQHAVAPARCQPECATGGSGANTAMLLLVIVASLFAVLFN